MEGYIFAFASVISFSLVNITDKLISGGDDKTISLLLRYFFGLSSSLIIFFILGENFRFPGYGFMLLLFVCGIIAYLVNVIMYKGLKRLNTGMFFMIGYGYLVFLFFLNIMVFGTAEIFSPTKTVFAFVFIIFILNTIYNSGKNKSKKDALGYFFAILCALGWTLAFGVEGYGIKKSLASPVQVIIFVYIGSITTALCFAIFKKKKLHLKKSLIAPVIGGVLISLGSFFILNAYRYLKLNLVNTLSISEILLTTVFAIAILKEKHSKKEIFSLFIGFMLLASFTYFG